MLAAPPCRACGAAAHIRERAPHIRVLYQVVCSYWPCEAKTQMYTTPEQALAAWSKRYETKHL